jgi:hypothetical protein
VGWQFAAVGAGARAKALIDNVHYVKLSGPDRRRAFAVAHVEILRESLPQNASRVDADEPALDRPEFVAVARTCRHH